MTKVVRSLCPSTQGHEGGGRGQEKKSKAAEKRVSGWGGDEGGMEERAAVRGKNQKGRG